LAGLSDQDNLKQSWTDFCPVCIDDFLHSHICRRIIPSVETLKEQQTTQAALKKGGFVLPTLSF